MWSLEAATPEDAPAIVELFRSGFPERLQPLVIYGCRGGSQYIADYTRTHRDAGVCTFVVCRTAGGSLGAFAEFRATGHAFFLNHIYVAPERRGQGLGKLLLEHGLTKLASPHLRDFALDVQRDNATARRWYESLGLTVTDETEWWTLDLAGFAPAPADWHVDGMHEAELMHARYGFSRFQLEVGDTSFTVGRLGSDWYRVTQPELLQNRAALAALRAWDPTRRILYLGPPPAKTWEALGAGRGERIAESLRMGCALSGVRVR